eukprot:753509-Hanusia_phi.AAC.4
MSQPPNCTRACLTYRKKAMNLYVTGNQSLHKPLCKDLSSLLDWQGIQSFSLPKSLWIPLESPSKLWKPIRETNDSELDESVASPELFPLKESLKDCKQEEPSDESSTTLHSPHPEPQASRARFVTRHFLRC